jgi:hypothetical protein
VKNCNRITYPLLAKVGNKLHGDKEEQAQTLWEHFYDEEIEIYIMNRLSTFRDVIDENSPIEDIIMLSEPCKYSLDFDYKRKPEDGGNTVPHKTIEDINLYRGVVNTLRDKKKLRATLELVEYYQHRSKAKVRQRFSKKEDCLRHFLRALTQCVYPFKSYDGYVSIVIALKEYGVTIDKLKNARRAPFTAGVVFNSSKNRTYIRKMLKALGYTSTDNYQAWLDLLIHKGLSNPVTMFSE